MKPFPWSPRRLAIVAFGCFMLLVAAGFLARTEWILGPRVASEVRELALRKQIDVEIESLRPHGFFGVTLTGVSVRIPRGALALEAHFERVDLSPRLTSFLRGFPEIGDIELHDGHAALVPFRRKKNARRERAAPADRAAAKDRKRTAKTARKRAKEPYELTVHNLALEIRAGVKTRRPLHLTRAEFQWRPGAPVSGVSGYGVLPDGQPFAAVGRPRTTERGVEYHLNVDPAEPTSLDRWIEGFVPIALSVRGLDVCLDCADQRVDLDTPVFRLPVWRDDISIVAPSATVHRRGGIFEISSPELEIAERDALQFKARVTRSRAHFGPATGKLGGRLRLADPQAGSLDLDWSWNGSQFDVSFWADDFRLASIWQLIELGKPVDPGIVNGSLDSRFDLPRRLVTLKASLGLRDLTLDWPFVAAVPLEFPRFHVRFDALIDLRAQAVSISQGQLRLGSTEPVSFRGRVVNAVEGRAFHGLVEGTDLNVITVQDALPSAMVDVVKGALLDGSFNFRLAASGHTAFPRSLHLRGDLDGDLNVLQDSPSADVRSLKGTGPPPLASQLPGRGDWLSYSEIPPMVRTILLAAEDASFFAHRGFDWAGFRRAMVHNLQEQSLERGGSTISQQVVKNLFLRPARTLTRKLQEAYLTWRMESEVSKERILEIYLNIASWGGGVRGIEPAADRYFDAEASELTTSEMALLAAILPNPEIFGNAIREGRLPASRLEKMEHIFANLRFLGHISPAQYDSLYGEAKRGKIGRLQLDVEKTRP